MWKKIIFIGILQLSLTALRGSCRFVKIGPCLFGWGKTCPDPNIKFYLFTKETKQNEQRIMPNKNSIKNSTYNPKNPNKVILHGYNSNWTLYQLIRMKNEYLEVADFNVWMVDWSEVANGPCYPVVVSNLDYVGKCIAQLIRQILILNETPKNNTFHIIGFSMGAHLAAYTANHIRPHKVARITGLDPALPLFTTTNNDHKLDKTDAKFVDVLHTDAFKEGKVETSGDADFYMNGGIEQPGCNKSSFIERSICNHYRSAAYFAESITTSIGFYGWPCKGFFHYIFGKCPPVKPTVLMGEHIDKKIKGSYIIHTASKEPFAMGKNYTISLLQPDFLWLLNNTNNTFLTLAETDVDVSTLYTEEPAITIP